ncbi:MAG: GNAT family N-acetyltransferase [Candidatus Eremiobacteraeota bacterium]|nr:GNAT family N-acetyltransferase [Candidatus Eremiobacteraeota bacterium]
MNVSVRAARDDDRSFIETLGRQTALETVSPVRAITQDVAEQAFRRLVAFCRDRPGTVIFIADVDAQPAGFLILLTDVPDDITQLRQAFVAYVAVREGERGQGVGRALIRAAIAEGQRRDLPHISLMVSANNAAARTLYESEDFQHDRILMSRPLRAAGAL